MKEHERTTITFTPKFFLDYLTMTNIGRSTLNLLLTAFLFVQCASFHVLERKCDMPTSVSIRNTVRSNLFSNPRSVSPRIFMTDDSKEQEDTESVEAAEIEESEPQEEKSGITRTVLLTVPLFFKFVIVLVIKFVTDLIVFPLLFLYRLAGIGKRRFYKLIGKGPSTTKANGET